MNPPFKKLHSTLKEKLVDLEITIPTPFQKTSIPLIKSGADLYCIAPKDSGKTTTLILTTLQKLKCEVVGTSPRAIVLVKDDERGLELYNEFSKYIAFNTLRVYLGNEKLHIDTQKSEIFEGIDILIATPKTVNKLLLLNGLSTSQIKIFSIDDAEFLTKNEAYTNTMAITQSISKCQFVLYSEKMTPILERLKQYYMENARTISV